LFSAFFEGSLSKPLICKASEAAGANYQQSYPQKIWICPDALSNQALSVHSDTKPEEPALTMAFWPNVVVATPAHSGVAEGLCYRSELSLAPGTLVRVPLGAREVLGVVWECADAAPEGLSVARTRDVAGVLEGLPPLNDRWRQLVQFASRYYQRSLGEVALAALPPQLRDLSNVQLARRLKRSAGKTPAPPQGTAESHRLRCCCSAPPEAARPRSTCKPRSARWPKTRKPKRW
jgi:primosomal protein N'